METKKGIAVSPGIVIAKCMVIDVEDLRLQRKTISAADVNDQQKRVRDAFATAVYQLSEAESSQKIEEGSIKDIFAVHMSFMRDRKLWMKIENLIEKDLVSAEYAVSVVLREIATHFKRSPSKYVNERAADIYDIERRILRTMNNDDIFDTTKLSEEVVIVSHDLSPTQTASFDRNYIKGFATNAGGRTSHTAIVARSLGIPAVVALEDVTASAQQGQTVIIDGNQGIVIIEPDEDTLKRYREQYINFHAFENKLDSLRDVEAVTRDGTKINITANIEFPAEVDMVKSRGADGIGLYRTEFLYLESRTEPTEEDHFAAYKEVLDKLDGKPMVIRTMDLGADKVVDDENFHHESNPVLGLRSIRYCLQNLPMFKKQLRAVLRASALGDVRVMFPLITNVQEIRQAKMILRDVMEDLDDEGIKYDPDMKVGIMIETPSAALMSGLLAREADFFSVGTNDLIQYTLAVDRSNEKVITLYSPGEPAVLKLLKMVIDVAQRENIHLSICGEMASEPEFILLLLGMGVRNLSMGPSMIPEIKMIVRSIDISHSEKCAADILAMESRRQVTNYLRDAAMKTIPEAL
ncbi:MAG: phosphoenolpyruvate--protein phosphotransferase [Sedimentisphaeraceae bacterium JB056]